MNRPPKSLTQTSIKGLKRNILKRTLLLKMKFPIRTKESEPDAIGEPL